MKFSVALVLLIAVILFYFTLPPGKAQANSEAAPTRIAIYRVDYGMSYVYDRQAGRCFAGWSSGIATGFAYIGQLSESLCR